MFYLREILNWLPTADLIGDGGTRVLGVSIDTRTLVPGDLFIALRGARVDANELVEQAAQKGACAALCDRPVAEACLPIIQVLDSRLALGVLAAAWRQCFTLPVVAVVGSNGKTTVKEMLGAMLTEGYSAEHVLITHGNQNNEIGVPLTLLRMRSKHQVAVLELGTNHPGEIAHLSGLVRPTVVLVTNAQREHQEFFDGARGSALENGAAIAALSPEGIAVFPGDDPCEEIWRAFAGTRRIKMFGLVEDHRPPLPSERSPFFSRASAAAVGPEFCAFLGDQSVSVKMAALGQHNVRNALAAAAVASVVGLSPEIISRGLLRFRPAGGRLVLLQTTSGACVIDDTYNANPDSVRAAIEVLVGLQGRRFLVLGEMREVGIQSSALHAEVGVFAAQRGVDGVFAIGADALSCVGAFRSEKKLRCRHAPGASVVARHFSEKEELVKSVCAMAEPGVVFLVKGSRSMRMEQVVAALCREVACLP